MGGSCRIFCNPVWFILPAFQAFQGLFSICRWLRISQTATNARLRRTLRLALAFVPCRKDGELGSVDALVFVLVLDAPHTTTWQELYIVYFFASFSLVLRLPATPKQDQAPTGGLTFDSWVVFGAATCWGGEGMAAFRGKIHGKSLGPLVPSIRF